MNLRKLQGLLCIAAALVVVAPSVVTQTNKNQKASYQNLVVARFDVKDGIDIPAEYLNGLTEEIVAQLQSTKKFKQVIREGEASTDASVSTIRLTGTVTEFKAGSRAKRYFIGFGAGRTKIVTHVRFIDQGTGEILFEDDVDGKVIIGIFGGDSKGAMHGLAKEVAKVTKKQAFRK